MKIQFIHSLVFIILLTACDDRFDFISELNAPPSLIVVGNVETPVFLDSIKTGKSVKLTLPPYSIPISVSDVENNLSSVNISLSGGEGIFTANGVEIANSSIPLDISSTFELGFSPALKNASYSVLVNAIDNFGASTSLTLNLIAFDNLLPSPKLNVTIDLIDGPFSAVLDAAGSVDRDERFGGGISSYEFKIKDGSGEVTIRRGTSPTIPWVFSGPGGHEVTVTVFDNDEESSSVSVNVPL